MPDRNPTHGEWDPMLELTQISPYLRVDSKVIFLPPYYHLLQRERGGLGRTYAIGWTHM
jgi:hypothetical protein